MRRQRFDIALIVVAGIAGAVLAHGNPDLEIGILVLAGFVSYLLF